jgi:hypothetical protein
VIKTIVLGAVTAAAFASIAAGARGAPPPATGPSWLVSPTDGACRTDLDLTGHSGAVTPVTFTSDGDRLVLRFTKEDLPERAFLPIRVDQKPFSNLMQRTSDPKVGELILSDETQAALRKGATLHIAWLADEPMSGSLAGGWRGLPDLKTCGAQVAGQYRAKLAADADARSKADIDARAKAVADAQLEAARAQQAAADDQRQRLAYEAQRQQAQDDAQRQQQAYAEQQQAQVAARERAEAERQAYLRRAYGGYANPYGPQYSNPYAQPQPQQYPAYSRGGYDDRDNGW